MAITDTVQAPFDDDHLMQLLDAKLVEGRAGHVVIEYTVRDTIVQRHGTCHGTCHGGVLFSLADAACGIAANAGGESAVTQHSAIQFMQPAPVGAVLHTTATTRSSAGRTRVYDVSVTDARGQAVAEVRCHARCIDSPT
ncbi:MAG: hotdog fold thioesterase [Pseudomonadota bacterium]